MRGMCFSAQVEQKLKTLQRKHGAKVDTKAFAHLFAARLENKAIKIPKGMEANWDQPDSAEDEQIHDLIAQYRQAKAQELETDLFKQKKRLADAQRKLQTKETKTARENERIATKKIRWSLKTLEDLRRTEPQESDSRIFPFQYAPVVIREHGENIIRPMRYHCRPAGKPAFYDRKFDGLYNARRDNIQGFWKGQFGHTHAVFLITGFYENVARHDFERRELHPGEKEENMVLHFNPQIPEPMTVACLWSHWEGEKADPLNSFAAITDEPPPEVAATGHDRCVIVLDDAAAKDWLKPGNRSAEEIDAILDRRPRLLYAHQIAA